MGYCRFRGERTADKRTLRVYESSNEASVEQ